jgi:hypothetical protein
MDNPHAAYPESTLPILAWTAPSRFGLIVQVWVYTGCVAVIVGGIVSMFAADLWLLVPIGILCVLVGVVGSLLAVLRTLPGAAPRETGLFR